MSLGLLQNKENFSHYFTSKIRNNVFKKQRIFEKVSSHISKISIFNFVNQPNQQNLEDSNLLFESYQNDIFDLFLNNQQYEDYLLKLLSFPNNKQKLICLVNLTSTEKDQAIIILLEHQILQILYQYLESDFKITIQALGNLQISNDCIKIKQYLINSIIQNLKEPDQILDWFIKILCFEKHLYKREHYTQQIIDEIDNLILISNKSSVKQYYMYLSYITQDSNTVSYILNKSNIKNSLQSIVYQIEMNFNNQEFKGLVQAVNNFLIQVLNGFNNDIEFLFNNLNIYLIIQNNYKCQEKQIRIQSSSIISKILNTRSPQIIQNIIQEKQLKLIFNTILDDSFEVKESLIHSFFQCSELFNQKQINLMLQVHLDYMIIELLKLNDFNVLDQVLKSIWIFIQQYDTDDLQQNYFLQKLNQMNFENILDQLQQFPHENVSLKAQNMYNYLYVI